jgi:hypothetical protein
MKTFFERTDNIIDKKLNIIIERLELSDPKNIHTLVKDITNFYALNFTMGNYLKAQAALDKDSLKLRIQDASFISFYTGILITLAFWLLMTVIFIDQDFRD